MLIINSRSARRFIYIIIFVMLGSVAIGQQIEGINYQTKIINKQHFVHIVKVDLTKVNIAAVRANPPGLKLETLDSLAKKHHALVGINGGFFHANGQPAGLLKVDQTFYGIAYLPRVALGWRAGNSKTALIDRVQTKTKLVIAGNEFPVHAMNRPLSTKRAMLSVNAFHGHINPGNKATHVVIADNQVVALESEDPINLPSKCHVYSIGCNLSTKLPTIKVGDPVTIEVEILPQLAPHELSTWAKMDFIVGGAPLLIYDGVLNHNFKSEKLNHDFINKRHARTAVGILADGTWVMVVVESNSLLGRQGMSIPELADFMQELGAKYALNLDGGGSSTMYLQDKIVSNAEGDEEEAEDFGVVMLRPISDAILITQ